MLSFLRWKRWLLKRRLQKKSFGSHVRSSWLPHLVSSRGLGQRRHRFHHILYDVQNGALTTIAAHSQLHLVSSTHCGTADGTLRRAGKRCPSPRTRKTGCRTTRSRCPSMRSRIEHLGFGVTCPLQLILLHFLGSLQEDPVCRSAANGVWAVGDTTRCKSDLMNRSVSKKRACCSDCFPYPSWYGVPISCVFSHANGLGTSACLRCNLILPVICLFLYTACRRLEVLSTCLTNHPRHRIQ